MSLSLKAMITICGNYFKNKSFLILRGRSPVSSSNQFSRLNLKSKVLYHAIRLYESQNFGREFSFILQRCQPYVTSIKILLFSCNPLLAFVLVLGEISWAIKYDHPELKDVFRQTRGTKSLLDSLATDSTKTIF